MIKGGTLAHISCGTAMHTLTNMPQHAPDMHMRAHN